MSVIFVDTNVLAAITDKSHSHHSRAVRLFEYYAAQEFAINFQVLTEFWAVATKPKKSNGLGYTTEFASALIERYLVRFRILPDNHAAINIWHQLASDYRITGRRVYDARIAASMISQGVGDLMTFNTGDFSDFKEITICSLPE